MKNNIKKLKLEELKVDSFLTSEESNGETLNGGGTPVVTTSSKLCISIISGVVSVIGKTTVEISLIGEECRERTCQCVCGV